MLTAPTTDKIETPRHRCTGAVGNAQGKPRFSRYGRRAEYGPTNEIESSRQCAGVQTDRYGSTPPEIFKLTL